MPKCSICEKEIEKLPSWLEGIEVKFRCAKCADKSAAAFLPTAEDDREADEISLGAHDDEAEEAEADIEDEEEI